MKPRYPHRTKFPRTSFLHSERSLEKLLSQATADTNNKDINVQGELALWRAIITQALMDASSHSAKPEAQSDKHDAIMWLTHNTKDFTIVCDHAGLDADYVRRMTKRALLLDCKWRADPGKGKRTRIGQSKRKRKPKRRPQPKDEPRTRAVILPFYTNIR